MEWNKIYTWIYMYIYTHGGIIQSKNKREILTYAITQMNYEDIKKQKSQPQKGRDSDFN